MIEAGRQCGPALCYFHNPLDQGYGIAGSTTVILGTALVGGGTGRKVVRSKLLPSSLNENLELYLALKVAE